MILGVLTIVILLVMRLNAEPAPLAVQDLALPAGTVVHAVTRSAQDILVVTQDRRLLVLSADGRAVLNTIHLD